MSTAKITAISHNLEPLALLEMAKEEDLEGIIILGFKKDGSMFFDRSEVDNANVIFGMEVVKTLILDESIDFSNNTVCFKN